MVEGIFSLQQHAQHCSTMSCKRRCFLRCFPVWASELPLPDGCWDEPLPPWANTWLWYSLKSGRLQWARLLRAQVGMCGDEAGYGGVRLHTLARHHKSQSHQRAVALLLEIVVVVAPLVSVPPAALFAEILQ